ncbi:MAG: SusD family [Bacteroidetes bacterium]|nr:SusD family [Bacteroidota bacterium]
MKTIYFKTLLISSLVAFGSLFSSCSLEEENPGGFTMEVTASTISGYQSLINQCYFAMERYFYGTENWITLTEGNTDLWTYQANKSTSYTQWFWFFAGAAPNTTFTNNWWNGSYDGIGSCNNAIALSKLPPYKTEEERNAAVAEARFLRAVYYFNAVEQFGAVTMITEPASGINFHPERTDPLTIYKQVIIPDLEFAFQWLPVGDYTTTTRPTKKSALGFLAKACLQTIEYDDTKAYAQKALDYAKMLIADAEAGGAQYKAFMYPTYDEVFAESNNFNNKEALWKHRWYAGADGHGSSNGNYKLNRNNEYFYCKVTNFGAIEDTQEARLQWGGNPAGIFMPTQHLLNLYVQDDNTLDPRFHKSFQTEWNANKAYTWDKATVNKYDRASSLIGTSLAKTNLAIKFIMPQDADYATESAAKLSRSYLVIDYKDIYNDANKNINMTYAYQNPVDSYTSAGTNENLFNYFYPSLTKHNSSNYYVANASQKRNGNLNATFIMRMAEVYLIAAEADIYVNGGTSAASYINKVRERAGAKTFTGTPTVRTVLDERGRELCGEYCRYYDLKRTGMLKTSAYLQETHPDLAVFFKPEYALKPISTTFTATLEGGGLYYQNPGY